MKRFLLILAIFGTISSFGQKKGYSIQAGVNYSMIEDVSQSRLVQSRRPLAAGYVPMTMNISTNSEIFEGNTGFFVSVKKDRPIYKRIFLTTGLSLEYRRFNRSLIARSDFGLIVTSGQFLFPTTNIPTIPKTQPIPVEYKSTKRAGDTEMLTIETPVYVGTRFFRERLTVQTGFNVGYLLMASQYRVRYAPSPPTIYTRREEASDAFNRLSYGVAFSTSYRFTKKFGVQFSALRNLSPLYSDKGKVAGDTYLNSFSAGVTYILK